MKPETGRTLYAEKHSHHPVDDDDLGIAEWCFLVTLLVTESRQQEAAEQAQGRSSPLCLPGLQAVSKWSSQDNIHQDARTEQIHKHVQAMLSTKVSVCIETLILPNCSHGQDHSGHVILPPQLLEAGNYVLLEQWTLQLLPHLSGKGTHLSSRGVVQAIKSYLHFSQLSAWIHKWRGIGHCNIAYRISPTGDFCTHTFQRQPDVHQFPECCMRNNIVSVCVASLPRLDRVPSPLCLKCHPELSTNSAAAQAMGSDNGYRDNGYRDNGYRDNRYHGHHEAAKLPHTPPSTKGLLFKKLAKTKTDFEPLENGRETFTEAAGESSETYALLCTKADLMADKGEDVSLSSLSLYQNGQEVKTSLKRDETHDSQFACRQSDTSIKDFEKLTLVDEKRNKQPDSMRKKLSYTESPSNYSSFIYARNKRRSAPEPHYKGSISSIDSDYPETDYPDQSVVFQNSDDYNDNVHVDVFQSKTSYSQLPESFIDSPEIRKTASMSITQQASRTAEEDSVFTDSVNGLELQHKSLLKQCLQKASENELNTQGVNSSLPLAVAQAKFQSSPKSKFHPVTGLPMQSSPAPLKKINSSNFDYDCTLKSPKAIKGSLSCLSLCSSTHDENDNKRLSSSKLYSTSAPASTNCLLGNFEESVLNGRIEPSGVLSGFRVEIGASGSFCPRHVRLPVTTYFFQLSDDDAPSPYLGHIDLEALGRRGYHVPSRGTIQVTLFNPNNTVVKMFVVLYDLSDMPASCQTFLRQRTVYMPVKGSLSDIPENPVILRHLIHLRFASSHSRKIYLHSDIRLIFSQDHVEYDPKVASYEHRSFTELPTNPRFSPKR